MDELLFEELTGAVIGAAIEVHRELGPGLLESCYSAALSWELGQAGIGFEREVRTPLVYRGVRLDTCFVADFVVEGSILVELKSVLVLLPVHRAQARSYMRLLGLQTGLLINFNEVVLRAGLRRVSL